MANTTLIGIAVLVIIVIAVGAYLFTATPATSSTTALQTTVGYSTSTPTTVSSSNQTTVATTTAPSSSKDTVMVGFNSTIGGNYLENESGYTLYIYTSDTKNSGTSACGSGGCATVWPPFYTASIVAPSGINASAFGTITRSDGTKQTTYMGYPLYYYVNDKAPGQINGQGQAGFYAATVPNLSHV